MENYQKEMERLVISCVISRKGGVPLNEINNDFCMLTGYSIPYLTLGYKSVMDFLLNIKDIYFDKNERNEDIIIAQSKRSKHLMELVAKQVTNNNTEDTSSESSFSSIMNISSSYFYQRNCTVLQDKNIMNSINPIVYGHQLIGDDLFVEIIEKCFAVDIDPTGSPHCGLCICGQTIKDVTVNICKQTIFACRVAVMIGLVDLLNGKRASEMIEEIKILLKEMKSRKLIAIFFTIPFIENIPPSLHSALQIFNKYLYSQGFQGSEFLNVANLDLYYEWMYDYSSSHKHYGNELMTSHERDIIIQHLQDQLLHNLNTNEE